MKISSSVFLIPFLLGSLAFAEQGPSTTQQEPLEVTGNDSMQFADKSRNLPINITEQAPVNPIKKNDKNEFVIAPIPFLNPSQGWGIALVGQYIFTMEHDSSPPSIVGGGAFYTEKKSFGGALGYLGKIDNDNWRLGLVAGKATLFYNFYGVGYDENKNNISLPIKQVTTFAGVQVLKHLGERIYLGLELVAAKIDININTSEFDVPFDTSKLDMQTNFLSPHLKMERDSRNNSFYPTEGSLLDLTAEFHGEALHDTNDYQAYKLEWNQYLRLAPFDVLAYRAMTRLSFGDVPFYDLSMFGQMSDLRGYESGKYRDKMMWAAQAEWRHRFNDWWGGVVFAGLGEVAPSVPDFAYAQILASGGLGIRFKIAQKNPVDFRFDTAYGDHTISYYFGVSQAF